MVRSLIPSLLDIGLPATRAGSDPFMLLHREMNRLFDDVLRERAPAGEGGAATVAPRMNISETGQEIRIDAELPGVAEPDVQVDLVGDLLTIRGEKRSEREDAQQHLTERSFGTFARTVRLPFAPRPEEVRATFEHGVLRITLPKSASAASTHRIPIGSAAGAAAQPAEAQGCLGTEAALAGHPTPNTTQTETGEPEAAARPP